MNVGIIVSDSFHGSIRNSLVETSTKSASLFISGCTDLYVFRNTFRGKGGHSLVDLELPSAGVVFDENAFIFENKNGSAMLRVLQFSMGDHAIQWKNNNWVNPSDSERVFYDRGRGLMYFNDFRRLFAYTDNYTRIPVEKPTNPRLVK
jgi:hypothetical protein